MASIDIGTLQGTLAIKNAYSDEFAKFDEEVKSKLIGGIKRFSDASQAETKKIQSAYQKVAASLDPVVANTQKYERAELALTAALKSGIITQEQYNRSLSQAKDKYLSSATSTLTWREEMQRLTNVITPFASRLANVSVLVRDLSGALGASTAATNAASASAATASFSFAAVATALAPLLPLLAAVAVAFGGVYAGAKAFQFLQDSVSKGIDTQKIIERLNNTLKATGSYAQLSSAQLVSLAESHELLSGKSKEEIIAAETILARFETLNNRVYPEALKVTLAYAKAMGITADQAASKLGPALEGNTRALASLKEAGIVLSASQRKTLQDMVDGGRVAEYQAKLLEILRQKVGQLSTEYDSNLSRQAERARIVLDDFGESIANQVIPAIEDVVSEIITSLGGWDSLKRTVNEVGGAIGNFIRTSIYGLAIGFNEIVIVIKTAVIPAFKTYMEVIVALGKTGSLLTVNKAAFDLYSKLGKAVAGVSTDVSGNQAAIERLTKGLVSHKTALEGDTKVYQSHSSAIGDVAAKNSELESQTKQLTKIYEENAIELEKLYALRILAAKGPLDTVERLKGEEKINDEYEYRLDLLRYQEQFGERIGKQLADMKANLRDLAKKTKVELELSMKLEPIKVDLKPLVSEGLKGSIDEAIDKVQEYIDVQKANTEEFQKSQDAYDQWVEGMAAGWVESFKSLKDIAEEEMFAVIEAVERGLLTASEGERALAEIRAGLIMDQMGQWQSLFSFIGSQFGGVARKIADALGNIQAAYAQGKQLDASGMMGGMSGAMGGIFATAAIFHEIYKAVSSHIKRERARTWGEETSLSVTGGSMSSTSYMDQRGKEISIALRKLFADVLDSLDAVVNNLPKISIKAREDGKAFSAYVAGVWVGTFKDAQQAMEQAVASALSQADFSSISAEYAAALKKSIGLTLEELEANIETASTARRARIGDTGVQYLEVSDSWNREMEATRKLGLAIGDIVLARNRELSALKNAVLGIDTTTSDALASLSSLNKGIGEASSSMRASMENQINSILAQIKLLENPSRPILTGGGGEGRGAGAGSGKEEGSDAGTHNIALFSSAISDATEETTAAIEALKKELATYTDELNKIPTALTDVEINMGIFNSLYKFVQDSGKYAADAHKFALINVELEFALIRERLLELGKWEEFAGMFNDALNAARAQAGEAVRPRRGGGGGDTDRDTVRDFIKDKQFELSLVGLTNYERALKELDRSYEPLLKQAGKDLKLRQELLDLKEKELALLEKESKQETVSRFREFLGLVSPFEKVRKTAADLVKEISASPFGDARKAAMIGRVMEEVDRQLTQMSKEMAVNLFGNMLSDMERFGATEAQMMEARRTMAIMEHELRLIQYAKDIAVLEAEGKLAPEVLATLKEGLAFLEGIDPTKFINPQTTANDNDDYSYSSTSNSFEDLSSVLKSVQDKLAEWNRVPLSETLQRAHELTDSFDTLMEDVRKLIPTGYNYTALAQEAFRNMVRGFIDDTLAQFEDSGSELENQLRAIGAQFTDINAALVHLGASQSDLERAERARLTAVQRVLESVLDPIREFRENRQMGDLSTATGEQQFREGQRRFREIANELKSGDLKNINDLVPLAQQYGELLQGFTGGEGLRFGMKEIDDTLLAIETLIPGFAAEMAAIGTESNPMIMDSSTVVGAMQDNMGAVNTGNTMMLTELRAGVVEMREQTAKLQSIEEALSNPLSVRDVA